MKRYVMLAHVGANKPITPGDAERLIHAMEIGGDRWPKGDMKADFVNIEYGRDFLTETKKYDVVIIHSIFHCRQDWLQQAMDKGLISKHHSEENWRKRLESTDAQMIFLVKTLPSCLEGWHLWQIPGYKMAMPDHFVTIYERIPDAYCANCKQVRRLRPRAKDDETLECATCGHIVDQERQTFEEWLSDVDRQLAKLNMARKDWEPRYPFNFKACFDAHASPERTAAKVNEFWWSTQPSSESLRNRRQS